ncbi:MAG: ADP-ribose pyrophosphatase [Gammaproteobacteria bacterium]|nr:ADP-ribose pyrophosphatase [Gammaproteobacteria bacterium]MBJ54272.1 ADP-ribose pyrophosphatase [Gammaproteobacteria bacterium]HBN14179.1 ADP-ribose pyrophosphatase [Pseudohongiella sp.]
MQPAKIGVGTFVIRNGKILLGKRIGADGAGSWGLPGGKLDTGERIEACARREVLEETGLELAQLVKCGFSDDIFTETGRHWVTIYFGTHCPSGEVRNLEPEFCERWDWFALDNLPQSLFLPLSNFLKDTNNRKAVTDLLAVD